MRCAQTFCGMSVVDGDWEAMKRFNVWELYEAALKKPQPPPSSTTAAAADASALAEKCAE